MKLQKDALDTISHERRCTNLELSKDRLAFTVKEAAQVLGLSESSVRWMIYFNEIPHKRIKARGNKKQGKIIIPKNALEKWLSDDKNDIVAGSNW